MYPDLPNLDLSRTHINDMGMKQKDLVAENCNIKELARFWRQIIL